MAPPAQAFVTRVRPLLVAGTWAIVVLDVVAVGLVAVGRLPAPPTGPSGGAWIFVLLTTIYGVVGARIVTRDGRNRVGWVLWTQPTLIALSGAGVGYAQLSVDRFAGSLPATAALAWAGGWSLVLFILLTALVIPLLFPTGGLPSPRWRPVAAVVTTGIVLTMAGFMFPDVPVLPGIPNPVGLHGADALLTLASQVGGISIVLSLPFVLASVVHRFRRGTGVQRQQVKWFAVGFLVPALLLLAALVAQEVELLWTCAVIALGLIPVTIGVAILRYRLYEIDRLVSRTIGWAVVTGVLVAVFASLVVVLQAVLAPLTKESTLAVAASTLIAFALFQPVRRRVQRAVDRRFDRAHYDALATADAFAGRLRTQTDLASVMFDLSSTTGAAVAPASLGVWIRPTKVGPMTARAASSGRSS
ncbi:MAG TPA: hypothetical protein VFQ75_09665 [Candidatus Limnocylindrales bacterium]|nr:hypothetical protein [Candidatus Limnocylindrales bacterium]